MFAIPSLL